MNKPRLLALYCGQGGACVGYERAGFECVGVDLYPMPRYPFEFHQADAFEYLAAHYQDFDALHASPVCKGYSVMNNLPWLKGREYPAHILPIREAFEAIGKPYVIENVMGARFGAKGLAKRGLESHGMQAGWLCGTMFGLPLYRHRLFETNFLWLQPGHPKHTLRRNPPDPYNNTHHKNPHMAFSHPRLVETATVKTRTELVHAANNGKGLAPFRNGKRLAQDGSEYHALAAWQQGNGAQAAGVGVGHAKGWRIAAEAMGVGWMDRDGTTQAVPPLFTEYVGAALLAEVQRRCSQ